MNPIADHIRAHLAASGTSMRALSLDLGQGEKFIADILSGKSKRPTPEALARLSAAIGMDLAALPTVCQITATDMIRRLQHQPPEGWSKSKVAGAISAIRWYVTKSGAGGPDVTILDPATMRAWLSSTTAAAQGLSSNSFSTYGSHLRDLCGLVAGGCRGRQIRDVVGPWRDLYDELKESPLKDHQTAVAGPFFAFCDGQGLSISEVAPQTFDEYLAFRLASGKLTASESKHRDVAMSVLSLWNRLAGIEPFQALGVRPVATPFTDGRDRYGMPAELLAPLLAEFDTRVLPWTRGETAPDGTPADEILDRLAPAKLEVVNPLKQKARAFNGSKARTKRREREERLEAAGLLLGNRTWGADTAANARSSIKSLAMAFYAQTSMVITSIAELTDPEILEAASTALDEATDEEGVGSSYLETVLKRCKKLALGFVQRPHEDIVGISALISDFKPDFAGVAPRNRRKLQQLTPERIERFINMSGEIIAEVNREMERRRRSTGVCGLDADLVARLEVALAHDIMLARAPRPGNLLAIDLSAHVRRRADGGVTIELPPEIVKNKMALAIPLGLRQSEFYDAYVDKVRPNLLTGDNQGNTRLFPARQSHDGACSTLLKRLIDEVHRRVGVRIHPHLYRHIVGWIWLRRDPNALPAVQKLLGHRRLETTMTFYAELDETLALQSWADHLEDIANAATSRPAGGRHRGGPRAEWRSAA